MEEEETKSFSAPLLTQASSPACTELEMIVMDWLGKMIGLPEDFLHCKPHSIGGGVIQVWPAGCRERGEGMMPIKSRH